MAIQTHAQIVYLLCVLLHIQTHGANKRIIEFTISPIERAELQRLYNGVYHALSKHRKAIKYAIYSRRLQSSSAYVVYENSAKALAKSHKTDT